MTEHLPECAVAVALPGTFTSCICDALRACEERAIAAAVQRVQERVWYTPEVSTIHAKSYDYGFSDCKERILTALRDLQEKP